MRVLVTGATGFIGAHAARAIAARGHAVRALVRSGERAVKAFELVGAEVDETVVGDATDADAVESALVGCDGVLHTASVYSLNVRDRKRIERTNARASELVLTTAHRLGLDPIVHISSTTALLSRDGVFRGDSPLGQPRTAYARSKAAADAAARRLQAAGAPVTIIYPPWVLGPDSPTFGVPQQTLVDILKGRVPLLPPGSQEIVDVRDLAEALAAALEPGRGSRRYLVAAWPFTFAELVDLLVDLTGRRLPAVTMPRTVALGVGRMADLAQRALPFRLPANYEGIQSLGQNARSDTGAARDELGFEPRPLRETLSDTIQSLVAQGRLAPKRAGRLAPISPLRAAAE